MTIICNKYLDSRDFTYVKESKTFVAEASDFGPGPHDGIVYDDACDAGFVLVSHKTGSCVLMVQTGVDAVDEEITGWRYKVVATQLCRSSVWMPAERDFTALIIND